MAFSGLNIPAGTTISSVTNGTTLVLSQAAVATGVQPGFLASATVGQREAVIYVVGSSQTLSGMISAAGLTKAGAGELVLTGNNTGYMTTAASITVVVSNSALYTVGQPFTGPGIPAGATVATIVDGKTITISAAATNSVTTQIGALAQLSGTITIDAGKLTATSPTYLGVRTNPNNPYTIDTPAIRLAGGTLNTTGVNSNNANYLNNITVTNDSTIDNGPSAGAARWGSLTFAARQGSNPEPIMLTFNNVGEIFTGNTVLAQNTWINATTNTPGLNAIMLQGAISGTGTLDKFGNGTVAFLSGANTMSGAITVHQGNLISLARNSADTPFGTSPITVQPGAALMLTTPNVGGGLTLNSDLAGIATIGLNYIGAVPAFTANNANTGGPFSAVIAIDVVGFDQPIDQSTLGGGKTFLGAAWGQNTGTGIANTNGANFIGTLIPGTTTVAASGFATAPSGSTYRFGGGGNSGQGGVGGVLNLNRTNLLTGANNVVFGAINNAVQANSLQLLGGSYGVTVMNTANNYSGYTTFNQDQIVQIGNNAAFGTSTLIFNGGKMQGDAYNRNQGFTAGRQIANNILFSGDINFNSVFNGQPTDLTFTGTVGLSNDAVGGSLRTITVNTLTYAQNSGSIATFSGVISDGASAYNSLNKAGAGTLRLMGTNTYTGVTMIQGGNIAITSTANLGTNPQVQLLSGAALSAWEQDFTLTKTLNFIGNSSVDVAEGRTLTQGSLGWTSTNNAIFQKIGQGTLVLTVPNNFYQLSINAGTVAVTDRSQLGFSNVVFNNVTPLYGTGGIPMLRFTANTPNIDSNLQASTAGAVSVDAGMTATFVSTGSTGTLYKVGTGTVNLAANVTTAPAWDIRQGIIQVGSYATGAITPLGTNASVSIAGGTLQLNATTQDLTATIGSGSINFSAGGTLVLNSSGTFDSQLTVQNINRSGFGTLVIAPTNNLGATTGQRSRIVVNSGGQILSTAIASTNVNGIIPPVIVRTADGQLTGDADFVTWNATNGLISGTPTLGLTSISGSSPTAVYALTAAQTLSGATTAYAVKTTANISGGQLQIASYGSASAGFGGILLNGAGAAAPVISSDVFFGTLNNPFTQLSGMLPNEGVVYAGGGYSSGVATLSGAVIANNFTKFGAGTLLFSGANRMLGTITVQSGIVQFGAGVSQPSSINIALNDQATIDLNGGAVKIGAFSGSAGIITNSSSTAGTFVFESNNASTFTGNFTNGAGAVKVIKGGTGTLTLGQYIGSNPFANINTQSGFVMRSGNLTVNTPYAFGNNSSTLELQGGAIIFQPTGVGPGLPTIFGTYGATTGGISVVIDGTSTSMNTDNNGVFGIGFQDSYFQFGNLTLGNSTFTTTPGTDYQNFRFAGTITGGNASLINITTGTGAAGRSVVDFAGVIQDMAGANAFAINKTSSGMLRISGTSNTYTGGTNVIGGGFLQVTATTGTPLGTGPVIVNPNGFLRLAGVGSVGGVSSVTVLSTMYNFGVLVLEDNFSPNTGKLTAATLSSAFGSALQIGIPNFVGSLDMSAIGDGNQFLGSYAFQLGNGSQFLGTLAPGAGNRYRLGAGGTLTFAGVNNTLTGTGTTVEIGSPIRTFTMGQTGPGNANGTVILQDSNNYTGGTLINQGSTLVLEVGGATAAAGGSTPLGTGPIEVRYGATLNIRGYQGSLVNAATGTAANAIRLRNQGTILLDDNNNGSGNTGLFAGAGDQGRWADAVGLTLDGGTFRLNGANNLDSYEKIGTVTVGLGGTSTIQLNRTNSGNTILEVADILRGSNRGMLLLNTDAGALNAAAAYDRLRVTTPTFGANGGSTLTGSGATAGMAPAWMIDITNNTFLTYQGSSLGLQPLLANPMPLGGQVAYLVQGAGIGLGLTGGTATVWSSAAGTLAYSPNIYALRMDSNLTTANAATLTGTLTVGSNTVTAASTTANLVVGQPITGTGIPAGAIVTSIINGTSFTISFKPSVAGAGVTLTPAFALTLASGGIINTDGASLTSNVNLIVPGSGELILYSTGGGTKTFSGQIVAGGLTKAGTGDILIQGDDRGTLRW